MVRATGELVAIIKLTGEKICWMTVKTRPQHQQVLMTDTANKMKMYTLRLLCKLLNLDPPPKKNTAQI